MLANEFSETCFQYENFMVWEIENMDAFFKGNEVLKTIFEDCYKIPFKDFKERRKEIQETDLQMMTKLLNYVDDKHFFIFTIHDENHLELVKMQRMKIMDFGLNIEDIRKDRVYVMIMDKKTASFS
ncbi:MAG: hypothetical protein KF732_04545 [Flavobacteriales bacterium]|nr:hypothetical protein [Flavobacteriales bacterium]MBX2959205.1 hypothetical protein [Flavobacteriales bacterium]MCL4857475.1 hypothetical protein [Flavobacteriales bacterium]